MDHRLNAEVAVGDVVIFHGAAGFTLDGDVLDQGFEDLDHTVRGEGYRWLKPKEIDAIDLEETERRKAVPIEINLEATANV